RQTKPELAFQIFMIGDNLGECGSDLAQEKVYIRKLKSYAHHASLAVAVKAMAEVGAKLGDPEFTERLQNQWEDWETDHVHWKKLTKACIDHILASFAKDAAKHAKREGEDLSYDNYFKNQTYMTRLMSMPLGGDIKRCARAVAK